MRYISALIIKVILMTAILWIVLGGVFNVSMAGVLTITVVLTALSFILGDLYVLPKYGNMAAITVDFGLALAGIWVLGALLFGSTELFGEAALTAAAMISVGEWFLHRYMKTHVFKNEPSSTEKERFPRYQLQTEFGSEMGMNGSYFEEHGAHKTTGESKCYKGGGHHRRCGEPHRMHKIEEDVSMSEIIKSKVTKEVADTEVAQELTALKQQLKQVQQQQAGSQQSTAQQSSGQQSSSQQQPSNQQLNSLLQQLQQFSGQTTQQSQQADQQLQQSIQQAVDTLNQGLQTVQSNQALNQVNSALKQAENQLNQIGQQSQQKQAQQQQGQQGQQAQMGQQGQQGQMGQQGTQATQSFQ
ncbi:YndM family protein [Shouchella shacheensis]|uniref:YndM family protein n=1 Tax=Shouchella shacheensis TaxID=1649580 RepID=UPI0009EAE4C5